MPGKKDEPVMPLNDVMQAIMTAIASEDKAEAEEAQNKLKLVGEMVKKNSPGFFTPFRSGSEFGWALASPVITPVVFGLVAGLAAVAAALAAVTALGSLVFAGGAALFNKTHAANDALTLAAIAGAITGLSVLVTLVSAIVIAVATPLSIVGLVTRSGATVVSAISEGASKLASCCCHPANAEDLEMQNLSSVAPR